MKHPGTIRFTEVGVAGERVVAATEVPGLAFANDGTTEVPVVHVERALSGDRHVMRSYAADGRLLLTTWQNEAG